MIINKNINQSKALKLVCLHMCYFFLLFHYLRELENAPFVFVYNNNNTKLMPLGAYRGSGGTGK